MCNGVDLTILNYNKTVATPPPTGAAGGVGMTQRREDLDMVRRALARSETIIDFPCASYCFILFILLCTIFVVF